MEHCGDILQTGLPAVRLSARSRNRCYDTFRAGRTGEGNRSCLAGIPSLRSHMQARSGQSGLPGTLPLLTLGKSRNHSTTQMTYQVIRLFAVAGPCATGSGNEGWVLIPGHRECFRRCQRSPVVRYGFFKTRNQRRRRYICKVCGPTSSCNAGTVYACLRSSRRALDLVASLGVQASSG